MKRTALLPLCARPTSEPLLVELPDLSYQSVQSIAQVVGTKGIDPKHYGHETERQNIYNFSHAVVCQQALQHTNLVLNGQINQRGKHFFGGE